MESTQCLSESDLQDLANIFRIHCIEMTEAPKSGFPLYLNYNVLKFNKGMQLLVLQWLKLWQFFFSILQVCAMIPKILRIFIVIV